MQNRPCLPLSQDVSCQIADHVNVIMTGFAEESKSSVIHMSSLFHAFVLCQVISKKIIHMLYYDGIW